MLAIFIAVLLVIAYIAFTLYSKLHGAAQQIKQRMARDQTAESANRRNRNGQAGEEVIDNRSPHEANRKIIPKNEGEYVDFEEEK